MISSRVCSSPYSPSLTMLKDSPGTYALAYYVSSFVAKKSFTFLHNVTMLQRRHDIQHNDTQHNDIQHSDTQHNGFVSDTQHKRHSA
jgi:hypothetical protein